MSTLIDMLLDEGKNGAFSDVMNQLNGGRASDTIEEVGDNYVIGTIPTTRYKGRNAFYVIPRHVADKIRIGGPSEWHGGKIYAGDDASTALSEVLREYGARRFLSRRAAIDWARP
jgi:hypothetical protein